MFEGPFLTPASVAGGTAVVVGAEGAAAWLAGQLSAYPTSIPVVSQQGQGELSLRSDVRGAEGAETLRDREKGPVRGLLSKRRAVGLAGAELWSNTRGWGAQERACTSHPPPRSSLVPVPRSSLQLSGGTMLLAGHGAACGDCW